ncbi:MAG TPA: CPBP family glutamic-type intramembrane protease [Candidatus Binataceae bacterium]|nr:CPBP family glutamic-type intramembrane protease [Candidatus Binataceae bacterium]
MRFSKFAFLEPVSIFAGIMLSIWKLRFVHPWSWAPLLALVIVSHVVRRQKAPALGFRAAHLWDCIRTFGPILTGLVAFLYGAGVYFGTIRPLGWERASIGLALYLPWGLFQQYLLNAYFLKRFETVLSPRAACLTTAALFSAVHSPNWFLMLVTPVAAWGAIQVYRKYSNLYFLGLAHATIGFLLFVAVPDSVSHHLNIGPGSLSH